MEKFQHGGTAVATFDQAAHRVSSTGGDTSGLGRWSWILFDAIFVSPQLRSIAKGAWISISESVGYHRALFIDLPLQMLLGEDPFTIH